MYVVKYYFLLNFLSIDLSTKSQGHQICPDPSQITNGNIRLMMGLKRLGRTFDSRKIIHALIMGNLENYVLLID